MCSSLDNGIPFASLGNMVSQNPVALAIPNKIGNIISASIITAPRRAPLPAKSLFSSVIFSFQYLFVGELLWEV